MFLFNKQLFDAAGFDSSKINWTTSWTWDEFLINIDLLNQTAGVQALSLAGMFFGAQPYYYGHGAKFFQNDIYSRATIDIGSNISRYALQFLKNLTDSTYTPPWEEQGWAFFVGDFMVGDLAMIATGPWEITNLLTNSAQFNGTTYGNDNLGFMQLPHDEDDNYGALIGGQYYVMSSQIGDPDIVNASRLLIKYLTSENIMAISVLENSHIPARLSVMGNLSVQASPSFQYVEPYFQQATNGIILTPSPYYGRLENAFGNRLGEYLSDDITLDELIVAVTADWYDILPGEPSPPFIPGYTPMILAISALASILGVIIYMMRKFKE
jgi:maltose-binding protein MalE